MYICPKCGGEIDKLVTVPWGAEPKGDTPLCAPFICAWCASLLLIVFEPQPVRLVEMTPEMTTALKRNHVLWKAIEHNRKLILAEPKQRPVTKVEKPKKPEKPTDEPYKLPSHCWHCGVYLQGGATIHMEDCPFYTVSYYVLMKKAGEEAK